MPTTALSELNRIQILSELEAAKFTYESILQNAESTIKTLNQPRELNCPPKHPENIKWISLFFNAILFGFCVSFFVTAAFAVILLFKNTGKSSSDYAMIPPFFFLAAAAVAVLTFFYGSHCRKRIYAEKMRMYEKDCDAYQRSVNGERDRLDKEKAETVYLQEIKAQTDPLLRETERKLQESYGDDLLFPKYRHFIAVTQIREYYESGRCNTLIGPDGAYNLFENELRMDRIINRLDQVLASLDQIQKNQYLIYEAIQTTNRLLNGVLADLDRISFNTAATAASAALTAYNTGVTNRLISMGYCD